MRASIVRRALRVAHDWVSTREPTFSKGGKSLLYPSSSSRSDLGPHLPQQPHRLGPIEELAWVETSQLVQVRSDMSPARQQAHPEERPARQPPERGRLPSSRRRRRWGWTEELPFEEDQGGLREEEKVDGESEEDERWDVPGCGRSGLEAAEDETCQGGRYI